MCKILSISLFLMFSLIPEKAQSQSTYYTSSKSCGSCGGSVSANSTIGMRCPHCRVRWGYENKEYSQEQRTVYRQPSRVSTSRYVPSFLNGQVVYANSNINVRSGPGTNYSIKNSVSTNTPLNIISRNGDWYYVSYSDFNSYTYELQTKYGYVAGWLLSSPY